MPFNDWGQLRGNGTAGWNASTNEPKLASGQGQTGFCYKVIVAGTTEIDGIAAWAVDDFIYFDGDAWQRITRTGGSGAETFLELLDTPDSYSGAAGQVVVVNDTENALEFIDAPTGVDTFLELTDTPDTYVGQAGLFVSVKDDETGLEFSAGGGGVDTFLELLDTPDSYSGQSLKTVRVNTGETALEFYDSGTNTYDITMQVIGPTSNSEVVSWMVAVRAFTIPASATGSYAKCETAPAANTQYTFYKNGVSFGTVQWAASATSGTFTIASPVVFAAGDTLKLKADVTADVSIQNIGVTIKATV